MSRFGESIDWLKGSIPPSQTETGQASSESKEIIKELQGEKYAEKVSSWKKLIEKMVAGEFNEEYDDGDKELGIQIIFGSGIILVKLDKKSSLLNNPFFLETFDDEFTRTDGDVTVVYSKTLD